jgi:subtilisin family serine protease
MPAHTRDAIDWAIAHGRGGKGCVVVFSSGNDGGDIALNQYASHPDVIAVGACNCHGKHPAYSGWGDALLCVVPSNDPGDPIGADATYTTTTPIGSFLLGDTYYASDFGFTSAAAAIVAGICARILAANPELTCREVREVIAASCLKVDEAGGSYDERGHSPYYGFGRLDLSSVNRTQPKKRSNVRLIGTGNRTRNIVVSIQDGLHDQSFRALSDEVERHLSREVNVELRNGARRLPCR